MEDVKRPAAESGGKRFRAARIFSVPEDVKFLDTLELTRLADAFTAWTERAGRPDVAVSRNRVRLIYLMLPLVLPTTLRLFRVGRLRLAPGRARVLRRSGKPFRLSGQGVRL